MDILKTHKDFNPTLNKKINKYYTTPMEKREPLLQDIIDSYHEADEGAKQLLLDMGLENLLRDSNLKLEITSVTTVYRR